MISGIIFILISWLVPNFPLWLAIVLTVFGAIKIQLSVLKYLLLFLKGAALSND